MPGLSLTDFVDVVSRSGTPKATCVKQIKNRPEYSPAMDFYKLVRERIIEAHRASLGKGHLRGVLSGLSDKKKKTAYPTLVDAYSSWWGRKSLAWFDTPHDVWSDQGVDVRVNPELGLEINGTRHLIKLYFKAEKLSKLRVDIITHLMELTLAEACAQPTTMSVLDVRNRNLISPTVPIPDLTATLKAEIAYIAMLWDEL